MPSAGPHESLDAALLVSGPERGGAYPSVGLGGNRLVRTAVLSDSLGGRVLAPHDIRLLKNPVVTIQAQYLPDEVMSEKNLHVKAVAVGGPRCPWQQSDHRRTG